MSRLVITPVKKASVPVLLSLTFTLLSAGAAWCGTPTVATGSVSIGAFANSSIQLTEVRYTEEVVSGTTIRGYGSSVAAKPGQSLSGSGSTYASLTNKMTYTFTMENPSPSIVITASGETTAGDPPTATSTITLGAQTATGSCSGDGGTYNQPKTVYFAIKDLGPGQSVVKEGSWTALANGG